MYETPKLIRYGSFRELTLQTSACPQIPLNQKTFVVFDPVFGPGQGPNDGCPRS
jgi:hypothetical protein